MIEILFRILRPNGTQLTNSIKVKTKDKELAIDMAESYCKLKYPIHKKFWVVNVFNE